MFDPKQDRDPNPTKKVGTRSRYGSEKIISDPPHCQYRELYICEAVFCGALIYWAVSSWRLQG